MSIPDDLQRLVAEVDGWLDLRCPDKALERLQPLLDRPGGRPEGLALRVRAFVSTKRHEEAMRDLGELRGTDYDPEWLDLTEAWCRKRLADLPGAVRCMEQLLERNPRSAIGHFNLGCYLALGGDADRAIDEVTLACGLEEKMRTALLEEPDLDTLHGDERFRQLLVQAVDLEASEVAEGGSDGATIAPGADTDADGEPLVDDATFPDIDELDALLADDADADADAEGDDETDDADDEDDADDVRRPGRG